MNRNIDRRRFLAAPARFAAAATLPAAAQGAWPQKPVKLYVGFPPGGGADAMARLIAAKLPERLGQPGGGGEQDRRPPGTISSELVAKAPPDGYTLQLAHINSNAIGPLLVAKGRFDPVADFTPIALIGITPQMLCHHPKHKFKDVPDLIRYAKANPGSSRSRPRASAASSTSPARPSSCGGRETSCTCPSREPARRSRRSCAAMSTSPSAPPVRRCRRCARRSSLLAVCSPKRLPNLPDVPAVAETLKGYEIATWYGLAGPAKLPRESSCASTAKCRRS
jgi:tripartite-type tricarboxylate transporter receptor subunit TctC